MHLREFSRWDSQYYSFPHSFVTLSPRHTLKYSPHLKKNVWKFNLEQGWPSCNYRCIRLEQSAIKILAGKPAISIYTWCTYIVFWLGTLMSICLDGLAPTHQSAGVYNWVSVPSNGLWQAASITLPALLQEVAFVWQAWKTGVPWFSAFLYTH